MPNAVLVNFAGGETSPKSRGRFDIQSYTSSCRKLVNFIAEVSGPARFRPGFRHLAETASGAVARLIPFQYNDEQAYMLEFTAGKMRVYKDGALQTIARTTVTAITKASPAVITVSSTTDLANGDTVQITGIVGMTELNGRWVKLAGNSGSTFQLVDPITGHNINSTNYGTYSSGGTLVEAYEIATPYLEEDLPYIFFAQSLGVMYMDHYAYTPRKLTVDGSGNWALNTYTRDSDPFVPGAALSVTGISKSNPAVATFASGVQIINHGVYLFEAVGGMTEVNNQEYRLHPLYTIDGTVKARLENPNTGAYIDSTNFSTYTSGGTATPVSDRPLCPAFYENRLVHAGTNLRPRTLFLSRGPSDTGASRFDDFTGGTSPDDACFFSLAPVNGSVDYIAWAGGASKYLLVGTFGGTFRVSGGGLDEPITPDSINVRQLDSFGCAAAAPALNGSTAFFIQRGGIAVRGVKYDADVDDFATYDLCMNAEQIAYSPLTRIVLQTNRPDILWALREDGQLAAMTVQAGERVAGWHRHKIGGADAKVIDIGVLPRPGADDQLYIVTERTVDGHTRRAVEVMADDVAFPDYEDFFTDEENEDDDQATFWNAVYRLQERYIHVDAAASYDGSDRGDAASATVTPGATTGSSVTFTASASVFTAADVGKEIWKKPDPITGVGSGRATITGYTSGTVVTCEVTVDFDSTDAIAAGEWYFAADEITGLWHLEGERVAVVADGAVYSDGQTDEYASVTVTGGTITLSRNCAVVHVGLPYNGLVITHNLEMGGQSGPAQDKPRNISRLAIRFMNTLGAEYGTDLYHTEQIEYQSNTNVVDRPSPVFSGVKIVTNLDSWLTDTMEKNVVIAQKLPLPCIVQFISIYYDTGDEA